MLQRQQDMHCIQCNYFYLFLIKRAILDCLWNAILGDRKNEQIFLNSEGV